MKAYIVGSGMHIPDKVVTNEDLAVRLGLDPTQIFKSSGIRNRYWVSGEERTSMLATRALSLALEAAGVSSQEIDYLLFGTMTPDRFIPGSASAVQQQANLNQIPCLDIRSTCCNAVYGLQLAKALVLSGAARNIALCLAEIQSPWLDLTPESGTTSMLFGDGASALIISHEQQPMALEIIDVLAATDGSFVDALGIRSPGTEYGTNFTDNETDTSNFKPRMVGQTVILHASRKIVDVCKTLLSRNNLTINDVRWLVPHQANANLLLQVARGLGFPADNGGVVSVIEEYGNTSSASMGIALDTLLRSGQVKPNDYLLLPAFGAGFTWGAVLCKA